MEDTDIFHFSAGRLRLHEDITEQKYTFEQVVGMNIGINSTANRYGNEGYFRLKWLASLDDENVSYWCGNQSCTPVIRYADVLLMMAECCIQTNDPDADIYLNKVRTRAQLPSKSNVTMDDLKLERRLELAMEAVRFQDLIRWGSSASPYCKACSISAMMSLTFSIPTDKRIRSGATPASRNCSSVSWR